MKDRPSGKWSLASGDEYLAGNTLDDVMSIVADFSVPTDAFCLGESLHSVPTATAELDRLAAHSPEFVIPFVWVLDVEQEVFDQAIREDTTVEDAEVTDSFEEANLYQFTWADMVSERLQLILDHEGIILEARGTAEQWRLRVRFGSRDYFADFQEHFQEYGDVTLHELHPPKTPGGITYGVSEKQRETLLAAHDAGYYDNPSSTSGSALAQQLNISQQAISRRLRRGTATLIENTLGRHRDE